MTAFYFDVLDDIIDKYNDAYHNTIKMKPIDVCCNSYPEYNVGFNDKDHKFEVGGYVINTKTFLLKDILLFRQKKFL